MQNQNAKEAAEFLKKLKILPEIFFILGSGIDISPLADDMSDAVEISTVEIRGFPPPTVAGHRGRLVFGKYGASKTAVAILFGRKHIYEGDFSAPMFVSEMFAHLDAKIGIFTSAVGGIDKSLRPGDIVLLSDILNFQGKYSLYYRHSSIQHKLYKPFHDKLSGAILNSALKSNIYIFTNGTYAAVTGPSYETPAEVEMLRRIGATVVGMSTAPEVYAANRNGIKCAGLSIVTNRAGTSSNHSEVLTAAERASNNLLKIIETFLKNFDCKSFY